MTTDQIARQFINALARAVDEDEPTDDEWHGNDPAAVEAREAFTASVRTTLTDWLAAPSTIAAIRQTVTDAHQDQRDPADAVSARLIAELHA